MYEGVSHYLRRTTRSGDAIVFCGCGGKLGYLTLDKLYKLSSLMG